MLAGVWVFTLLLRGVEETPESVTDLLTLHVVELSGGP